MEPALTTPYDERHIGSYFCHNHSIDRAKTTSDHFRKATYYLYHRSHVLPDQISATLDHDFTAHIPPRYLYRILAMHRLRC
jgi:hypothetical protein